MSREVRAQALVLESVLTHRPLPGISRAVVFADATQAVGDPQALLVDDRDPSELGLASQLRVISHAEFEDTRSEEQLRYLEFLPPEHFPGKISVRLRLSIALPDGNPVPLEGIVATFNDRDPLTAVDPTHVLAY